MTKRQQIMDAVKARMETISIGNNYSSNLGERIFVWRLSNLADTELPAIVIRDVSNSAVENATIGMFRWALGIELQIICSDGSTTADQLRAMIQDVYTAIGTDTVWSALANLTTQPSDEMQIVQEDRIIGGATIRFNIEYDSALWAL